MKPGVILSLEQALSMTYATLRFAQLGWRVVKLEATPQRPGALPGDPNRYIGGEVGGGPDRCSYFVAPNVGKESVALDLKSERGREALRRIIRALDVDVFCVNTLPARYGPLGIEYDVLRTVKPDLIWAGISAFGPDHPNAAGYDPALQAVTGYMDVTGQRDGPPTLCGVPVIDLKAGDEVFANVWMALAKRATTGEGSRVDVSMFQAAASWLITLLPLIDMGCEDWEISRAGNEHRKFVPTNAYPAADGSVLIAIGSDALWRRFTAIPRYAGVAREGRATNNGRIADRETLHADIAAATRTGAVEELCGELRRERIPHAPVNGLRDVLELPQLAGRTTFTETPDGRRVRMQPKAVDLGLGPASFGFAPRYGEHTRGVLDEAGYGPDEIEALIADGAAVAA